MSLRFPSAITNRPRSLAAFTVFSNASITAEPYCSKNASCGFTAGTRSATVSTTSSWKSPITARIIARVGALWPDCIKAGISSMRGSSPTTQGLPLLRTASTSRSENGCMNLYYCPTLSCVACTLELLYADLRPQIGDTGSVPGIGNDEGYGVVDPVVRGAVGIVRSGG